MAFGQMTYSESLRDIEACLRSVGGKLYHMGFRGKVARSTLADANESRDWRIYADFAQVLIALARCGESRPSECFEREAVLRTRRLCRNPRCTRGDDGGPGSLAHLRAPLSR